MQFLTINSIKNFLFMFLAKMLDMSKKKKYFKGKNQPMPIKELDKIVSKALNVKTPTVAVANGVDTNTLHSVSKAVNIGLIKAIIFGKKKCIDANCKKCGLYNSKFQIVDIEDEKDATIAAIKAVADGEADILMKGLLSTDLFIKLILDKKLGLTIKNQLLSHMSLFEIESYQKLLLASDVAIIPNPSLDQKKQILSNLVDTAHKIGIVKPKVALIAASEKIIPQIPANNEANQLKNMFQNKELGNGYLCDGPLSIDLALNHDAAKIKNYKSEVSGDADCLLFPNIESGNVFYKTCVKLFNSKSAAIVIGAKVPIVLPSRGDNFDTKLYSIALSVLLGQINENKA